MMYEYLCEECGAMRIEVRMVADRDKPVWCRSHGITKMRRIMSLPHVNADLTKDRPENDMYRVISRSSSATDKLECQRREEAKYIKTRENFQKTDDEYVPMSKIDVQGAWNAAQSGNLAEWRKDNVKEDWAQ